MSNKFFIKNLIVNKEIGINSLARNLPKNITLRISDCLDITFCQVSPVSTLNNLHAFSDIRQSIVQSNIDNPIYLHFLKNLEV